MFEWHFTVRGPADSDFDGGIYHGRMIFPAEYPMKPPNIILLTVIFNFILYLCIFAVFVPIQLQPNGRFELNKKICLSISGYHPETWLPSWSSELFNNEEDGDYLEMRLNNIIEFVLLFLPSLDSCLLREKERSEVQIIQRRKGRNSL